MNGEIHTIYYQLNNPLLGPEAPLVEPFANVRIHGSSEDSRTCCKAHFSEVEHGLFTYS